MLFDKQISRKPDNYPELRRFIRAIQSSPWTVDDFNFRADFAHFKALPENEQLIITKVISAIAQIEVAVKQFWGLIGRVMPQPGVIDVGFVMAANEVVHNQAYERLLEVLGLEAVFEQNLQEDVIRGRVQYLNKWLEKKFEDDRKQFIYALTLFTLFVEKTSLFSQFYTIMHFNRFDNIFKDLPQQINYTMTEEELHANLGIYLINTLRKEYPELFDNELREKIVEECQAAFEAESAVVDWYLGDFNRKNLNAPILKSYIKVRLNEGLDQIGYGKPLIYTNEELALLPQTRWLNEEEKGIVQKDFFNSRPTEYSKHDQSFSASDLFG